MSCGHEFCMLGRVSKSKDPTTCSARPSTATS
ncbi:hypothetical protein CesoFtcFv8_008148 [Champsocephalus esox]|uniref:Uncharacterized protein n=1 Tax=Champsocephalus esox TaxID=159716 RepID=A0AAN8CIA5_9TELE|nr:hypothetical protein CesoFtcFv8_008148 [Champsocephalus esox]